MDPDRLREMRAGAMAMIYQDPQTSLNPVFTIGEQIAEAVACIGPTVTPRPMRAPLRCCVW